MPLESQVDAAQTSQGEAIAPRQHSDSPQLWMVLVGGSVAFHLLLLLGVLPLSLQFATGDRQSSSPTPVELVDLSPEIAAQSAGGETELSSESAPESIAEPSPESAPESAPELSSESVDESATPAPSSLVPQSSVDDLAPVDEPPSPSPTPSASPAPSSTPTPSPSPAPVPSPLPSPVPTVSPSPTPTERPADPVPSNPVPSNPVSSNPDPTASPGAIAPVPGTSPIEPGELPADSTGSSPAPDGGGNPNQSDSSNLPQIPVGSNVTPAQLVASIAQVGYVPAIAAVDLPEVPPAPVGESQTFASDPLSGPACLLDPESQRDLGQTLALQLVIESDGRVSDVFVWGDPPNVSPAYVELATCMVKNWQFAPAQNGTTAVASDILIVYLTINVNR